jgi:hypothetical protein
MDHHSQDLPANGSLLLFLLLCWSFCYFLSIIPNCMPGILFSFSLHWACHQFFPSNFNITCHLQYLAHFYPENADSMFFLNSGTHPPDYLPQRIKPPHESSLSRNSKSHKIIIPVCFNGTPQLQMKIIYIYTVLLSTVL